VFSCSKIEQKQLNTWVSFQSAEQPLLGQFSVSGNTAARSKTRRHVCRERWRSPNGSAIRSPRPSTHWPGRGIGNSA